MLSGDQVTTIWTTAAAAGGALGGAAVSAVVTFRVTQRQVNSAKEESALQRSHELELTAEDRRQERILDAYVTLTRYVTNTAGQVEWKLRDMKVKYDPPLEPPPIDSIEARSLAAATLVASVDVERLLMDYNRSLNQYRGALGVFEQVHDWEEIPPFTPDLVAQRRDAREAVEKEGLATTDLANKLILQMRLELGAEVELPPDSAGLQPTDSGEFGI